MINIFFRLYNTTTLKVENALPLYLINHLALKQGEHLAFYQQSSVLEQSIPIANHSQGRGGRACWHQQAQLLALHRP